MEKTGFMMKRELRARMRARNRALDPAERAAASCEIFRRVERLEAFAKARTVGVFCSLPDEPDTREALARWGSVKRVAVPRVEGASMRFFRYDPCTQHIGAFGIEEPGPEAEECLPGELDLIVVPGVAFTSRGERMGRGRGYYDRYLTQPTLRAVKIGVCFAHQLVDTLPVEPHDVPMDCVVTEAFPETFPEAFPEP